MEFYYNLIIITMDELSSYIWIIGIHFLLIYTHYKYIQ